jgi:hypothetical protein
MVSYTKQELISHIGDLDCQIEYLSEAIKHNLADQEQEFRLNALIVKRAHWRKELDDAESKNNVMFLIDKLKRFSRKPTIIRDYF